MHVFFGVQSTIAQVALSGSHENIPRMAEQELLPAEEEAGSDRSHHLPVVIPAALKVPCYPSRAGR